MLPLYDLLDHRPGEQIRWEAGGGSVRFRCAEAVSGGQELFNNYGSQSNGELLYAHGFAMAENVHDTVDGFYRVHDTDDSLLVGPFSLGGGSGRVIPLELLVGPQVVALEAAGEQLALSLDDLEGLGDVFQSRLDSLLETQADDAAAAEGTRESFCAHYRDGQRRVLRAALAELAEMFAAAAGGEESEDESEESAESGASSDDGAGRSSVS